MGHTICIVGE